MSLALPCLLTVLVETAFLVLLGYRDGLFLSLCACVNAATNLALNLLLPYLPAPAFSIYIAEILVVAVEYAAYSLAVGRSRRLFLLTFAANLITYLIGIIIYGPVG